MDSQHLHLGMIDQAITQLRLDMTPRWIRDTFFRNDRSIGIGDCFAADPDSILTWRQDMVRDQPLRYIRDRLLCNDTLATRRHSIM